MYFPLVIQMITDETDREFMKALYIKHRVNMFRMARAMTTSEQEAEDVVSEACVSLIKKNNAIKAIGLQRFGRIHHFHSEECRLFVLPEERCSK